MVRTRLLLAAAARRDEPARRRRAATRLGRTIIGLLLLASLAGRSADAAALTVAIGGPAEDPAYLPVHAAAALETFRAEGVEVTLRRVKHATAAATALRQREADLAVTALDQAIQGVAARDVPIRLVVAHTRAPAVALVVSPAVRDAVHGVADLRGRTVGIPGPGTTGHLLLLALLRQARVEPWQLDLRSLGGAALAGRVASGELPAAILEEPWASRILEAGRGVALVDFRRPEETARVLGGPFYEIVTVGRRVLPPPRPRRGPAPPPPPEEPPDAALAAFARAVVRVQAWLATAPVAAIADRLPPDLVRDRARFAARLAAARDAYAADGDATLAGLTATLRALRLGTPWPVSLKLGPDDLLPPPAVAAARRDLGWPPPPP
jgi:ABC-type nitrate/sulfonate/bicarbonate transport system substrate-binding protein